MSVVKSVLYPELTVFRPRVQFHDGQARVDDADALEALRGLSGIGVSVPAAVKTTRTKTRRRVSHG